MKRGKIILTLTLPLFVFFLILCSGNEVFAMSGRVVFKSKGCLNCHTINGSGGKAGPNLSNIGAKKSLTWLEDFIKNPDNYFNPGSSAVINGKEYIIMMPAFKNMLSEPKLNAVANYLESQK
jgi:mono/diheme cytochrome c family protein